MADTNLKEVLKNITKSYGDNVVKVGVEQIKEKGTLSLGTPSLDFITYNSIPQGCFIEVTGQENSGKTLLAYLIARSYIQNEQIRNPDNPRKIVFIDNEYTADPDWAMISTGYNMNDEKVPTIYITPQGQSMEEILSMAGSLANTGEVGLVIIDSLTSMATEHTAGKDLMQKEVMGGTAKTLGEFVRRYTGVFNANACTVIGINGSTMNITGYGNPWTTSGGTYWKRACSLRLMVKKGALLDEDGNELKSTAENPAGNLVEVALLKSKFCRSDRKLGVTHLYYSKGLDIIQDTVDIAIYFGLIDNSSQGSYKLLDPDTKEILLDDDGNEIKIRGKKNVKPYFEEHKEIFKRLYNKTYEMLSNKEDTNFTTFEKMFGVENIEEHLGINLDTLDQ